MTRPANLFSGIFMVAVSLAALWFVPRYRQYLTTLAEAGQLHPADARRKLRSFLLLIGLWVVLAAIALYRAFQPD